MSRGQLFAFIAAEKTAYGVRRLCRVFSISPTTFYAWARRGGGPTPAELEEAYAIHAPHQAWVEHRRTYGARRMTAEINHRGHPWNRKRVAQDPTSRDAGAGLLCLSRVGRVRRGLPHRA